MTLKGLPEDPAAVFQALRGEPVTAFLDAGDGSGWDGRSVIGLDPIEILSSRGTRITHTRSGRAETRRGDPLEAVRAMLARTPRSGTDTPDLIGYLGYELGGRIERLPMSRHDDLRAPELWLARFGILLIRDHRGQAWRLLVRDGRGVAEARRRVMTLMAAGDATVEGAASGPAVSGFRRRDYLAAVRRARRHIRDGDIYQVNLSQRFRAPWRGDPWALYRRLRRANPAPYACWIRHPGLTIVGASPELFLHVRGREVGTRPIKGTRRRGKTRTVDRALEAELRASPKDRAELSMIVDLERNDLGRVCEYGTVRVAEHAALERHPTVFHTVSTVTGRMASRHDLVDLIRATFPGGSISGCPKIRAMEIIDDLEPTARGPYTGSMGWLSAGGDALLNIAIRTLLVSRGTVSWQVGGAIVADSDPASEYEETLVKGAALSAAARGP